MSVILLPHYKAGANITEYLKIFAKGFPRWRGGNSWTFTMVSFFARVLHYTDG
jgi:hypothetical protein